MAFLRTLKVANIMDCILSFYASFSQSLRLCIYLPDLSHANTIVLVSQELRCHASDVDLCSSLKSHEQNSRLEDHLEFKVDGESRIRDSYLLPVHHQVRELLGQIRSRLLFERWRCL